MRLQFTRLVPHAVAPTQAYRHDAGVDLHAAEPATLAPGERASVGTGLAVEIPQRFAGLVLPRSGLAARHGIALVNAPGLVDAGYRGEIRVLLLNTDPVATFEVAVGDRIAQLLVVRHESVELDEVDELTESDRGAQGFGSSGTAAQAADG